MKKIATLNLFGFIEFYKILKEKCKSVSVEIHNHGDELGYEIMMSKVSAADVEEGETLLEIRDPSYCLNGNALIGLDEADTSVETIAVGVYVSGKGETSAMLHIPKKLFDDDDFIIALEEIIGLIAPVRKKVSPDVWHVSIEKWIKKVLSESKILNYGFRIETFEKEKAES